MSHAAPFLHRLSGAEWGRAAGHHSPHNSHILQIATQPEARQVSHHGKPITGFSAQMPFFHKAENSSTKL